MLLSLLATENKDNSTKLRILLGEACVAVYLSLLALAWSNSQPNQLYRLVVNSLKAGMWGMVFGGGLRSALQQSGGGCSFYLMAAACCILNRSFVAYMSTEHNLSVTLLT